jgi:hypothetical protein
MSRRGRWARIPVVEDVPAEPAPLPSVGPVVFTVSFADGDREVDLSDLPHPRLVRCLGKGLQRYAEDGTLTTVDSFDQAMPATRQFVTFIAAAEEGESDLGPEDLESDHIDAFEQALLLRPSTSEARAQVLIGYLVRTLRKAHEAAPGDFGEELVVRIGFASRQAKRKYRPLDARRACSRQSRKPPWPTSVTSSTASPRARSSPPAGRTRTSPDGIAWAGLPVWPFRRGPGDQPASGPGH